MESNEIVSNETPASQHNVVGSSTLPYTQQLRPVIDPTDASNDQLHQLEAAFRTILSITGANLSSEVLSNTPLRAAKAMLELTQGYENSLASLGNGVFPLEDTFDQLNTLNNSNNNDDDTNSTDTLLQVSTPGLNLSLQDDIHSPIPTPHQPIYDMNDMVVVRDIPFSSLCEHHMLPFSGTVHIGYMPRRLILGLSKFARLTELLSRRFQVQERLTKQICTTLHQRLRPHGVIVCIDAEHNCMSCRGIRASATTVTCTQTGCFQTDRELKRDFFAMIDKSLSRQR